MNDCTIQGEKNAMPPKPNNFPKDMGRVSPNAKFTQHMANKFGFKTLAVYGFSYGPTCVLTKKLNNNVTLGLLVAQLIQKLLI